MPPKTKFNRENIIKAAFDIAKENGFSAITARSVAKRLGSSVAPIYVNFKTIEHLIEAAVQLVFTISNKLMEKQTGPNIFENIGKASLEFARDYPVLFRELAMQPNQYMVSYEIFEQTMLEAMSKDKTMRGWTMCERKRLLFKMSVFQIGLSAIVANGHVPSWLNEKEVGELLMEIGEELLLVKEKKQEEKK